MMSGTSSNVSGGSGEGDYDYEGDGFLLRGVKMESSIPTSPITPTSSGHRSRKEKLVLRSFSTENDDIHMAFDEPRKPQSRGSGSSGTGKRASRTKRVVSAPEHLARKLSQLQEEEDSLMSSSFEESPTSRSGSPVGAYNDGERKVVSPMVDMSMDEDNQAEPTSPRKSPKKRKLEINKTSSPKKGKNLDISNQEETKVKLAKVAKIGVKTKKHSASLSLKIKKIKKERSSLKKNRPRAIPAVFKNNPSRLESKHKFRVTPKKLPISKMSIKLGKRSIKGNALYIHKPALVPSKISISEKPVQSQVVSVRKQKKWLPRRQLSRNMLKNVEDHISKLPSPLDDPLINAVKPESKSESPKSKLPDQKNKSKRRSELEEEGREEQELMHYATGFSCLEELLDGRGKVILPELYHSMIQSLSDTIDDKTRWGPVFRDILSNSRQEELHRLLEDDTKSQNKSDVFRPLFRMTAILEDKPTVSYPLITKEELEAYEVLINHNADSECWDDELECGNLFIDMIEMDLHTLKSNKRTVNGAARIQPEDDKKGLKRVYAKVIPVNYSESQNDHGLFIPEDEFKRKFLTNKRSVLKELNTRSLRNGKQVELKNIKLPSTKKKLKSKNTRKNFAKIVPEYPITCPENIDKDTMNLRNGRKIQFTPMDSAGLLQPAIKLELIPEVIIGSPVKTLQQDDYSRRVEADLRRLEAGEDLLFFDLNNPEISSQVEKGIPCSNSIRASSEPRYMTTVRQLPLTEPLSVSNPSISRSLFGPSASSAASTSLLNTSDTQSQYFFKPIQPQPLSTGFVDTGQPSRFHKDELKSPKDTDIWGRPEFSSPFLPSDQISSEKPEQSSPIVRKPYSRHRHSKICPPFDNNHCSFSEHFCTYPRADPAGSRFCLQHVQEGATVNFERCKYVKGSRECGKFIPKAQFQSVFCDMHARAVAKARLKKMKPAKPLDPSIPLLKSIKKDLERTQGKVLEEDGSGYFRVRRHLFTEDNEAVNNSSDSETEDEYVVDDYLKNQGECDSDLEDDWTPPNELDYDVLKNAGFYSVTEVAQIYRSKLMTLQKLYLRQMELMKKKYVDSRKEFLRKAQAFRQLRTYITTNPKYISHTKGEYAEEYLQYQIKTTQETRAFLKHARLSGNRALMHMELMKKRLQLLELGKAGRGRPRKITSTEADKESKANEIELVKRCRKYRRAKVQICSYVINGEVKCCEKVMPLAKYCHRHIIHDPNQKLFTSCNFRFGPDADDICKIAGLSELGKFGCPLHNLPIPVKDPPETDDTKPKVEDELEKLVEKLGNSSSSSDGDEESESDEEMVREMEELVGDEVVDLDHFQEMVNYLQNKGFELSDTEESDDTDEDEPEKVIEELPQI